MDIYFLLYSTNLLFVLFFFSSHKHKKIDFYDECSLMKQITIQEESYRFS